MATLPKPRATAICEEGLALKFVFPSRDQAKPRNFKSRNMYVVYEKENKNNSTGSVIDVHRVVRMFWAGVDISG